MHLWQTLKKIFKKTGLSSSFQWYISLQEMLGRRKVIREIRSVFFSDFDYNTTKVEKEHTRGTYESAKMEHIQAF